MKSTRGLADTTTRLNCSRAKQFLAGAAKRGLVAENPFARAKASDFANWDRRFFVTREQSEAVLKACPTDEWRLIFALCRYGGLRCPSEVVRLRWKDVDWARMRFAVHTPRTERCRGGTRHVPIFPEILPHLLAAFRQTAKNAEHVVTRYSSSTRNIGGILRYALSRAGIALWPKLFQNLRSTRETELAEEFPLHVAGAWIGNARLMAMQYCSRVAESYYEQAVGGKTTSVSATRPRLALPARLVRSWAALPAHLKEAIMLLATTASGTRVDG